MIVRGYKNGVPFDLEVVPIDVHGHLLAIEAAADFIRMDNAALTDGVNLVVNTAWRDNDWQVRLYTRYTDYVRQRDAWLVTPIAERGPEPVKSALAAKPGYSNHQAGTAIDINSPPLVATWLDANALKFNFKRTVPSEIWHYDWAMPTV